MNVPCFIYCNLLDVLDLFKTLNFFLFLCTRMCECRPSVYTYPWSPERVLDPSCNLWASPWGSWELSVGPLTGKQVLLTSESPTLDTSCQFWAVIYTGCLGKQIPFQGRVCGWNSTPMKSELLLKRKLIKVPDWPWGNVLTQSVFRLLSPHSQTS